MLIYFPDGNVSVAEIRADAAEQHVTSPINKRETYDVKALKYKHRSSMEKLWIG